MAHAEAKHPDVLPGTPSEKAELLQNTAALKPRQNLYLKITAYCPIEEDKSVAFEAAVDAFEAACGTAEVDAKFSVELTPPLEGQPKRAAEREAKREARRAERRASGPEPKR